LDADGEDVNVSGDNGTGKTRLASAFSWLLFGKDSLGRVDFELKNLDAQGEAEHGLEHSVEGTLSVDGETVTLRRVYSESWTKKRGSATSTFSGHSTQYYVDGVPKQEKDYKSYIADLAGDESIFRLLTSPTVAPALHWQKLRALLLDVCGDMTDADVIASDAQLAPLAAILGKKSIDDHRKVVTARKSEINRELTALPVRIDEQRRSLPNVTVLDRGKITAEIASLETSINASKLKLQGVDTGGAIADLSKRLAGVNADIQKLESGHYTETMKTVNGLNQQATEAADLLRSNRNRLLSIDGDTKSQLAAILSIDKELSSLRDKWTAVDAETFQDTTVDTCAACGQSLPVNRVQEAREKALAAFNLDKAERLGLIERRGHDLAEDKERRQGMVDALGKEREIVGSGLPEIADKVQTVTAERDLARKQSADYTTIPGRSELHLEAASIQRQIEVERAGHSQDAGKIREEISTLSAVLLNAKADADKFTRREQGEKRIEELKESEKKLAAEFEKLEGELYLCDQFIKTKVSLLNDRINGRFEIVRFRLFTQNINGGIEPSCEITVNGIPYNGGLNSAARTNAGLDICRTLSEHYGILAPTWVDNAESVSHLVDMKAQVIRLVVSEPDKALRVEMARQAVAA